MMIRTKSDASMNKERKDPIEVKICGLTRVSDAVGCAEMGVDAVGCVFFPKSPRHVTPAAARDISRAVSPAVGTVGVFVDADYETVMRTVEACGLTAVQLHGRESPRQVRRIRKQGIRVIKALFVNGRPAPDRAADYPAHAFLVECAQGPLPGGNAMAWHYESIQSIPAYDRIRPLILAGGLSLETVSYAIEQARPDAVDVSSGVEQRPGVKSMDKVWKFLAVVSRYRCTPGESGGSIFRPTRTDIIGATG